MNHETLLFITLTVGTCTYLIRTVSLSLGSRIQFPPWAREWLSFVTPAVLGALLGPTLFLVNGSLSITWRNLYLLSAIPTFLVAWKTKNLLWTILAGLVTYGVLQHIEG